MIKKVLFKKNKSIYLFLLLLMLTSCSGKLNEDLLMETGATFVPEPANKFAIEKELVVETAESTEAHRPYPSDFKIAASPEVVIGEKQFLTRINYIYNHIEEFEKSKVVVEGMYGVYTSWDETFEFPMVYRNGPGDYGDDKYGGFYLVNLPEGTLNLDDWIRVRGTPFMYEHTDSEGEVNNYLFLLTESVEVLPIKERKAEMVND